MTQFPCLHMQYHQNNQVKYKIFSAASIIYTFAKNWSWRHISLNFFPVTLDEDPVYQILLWDIHTSLFNCLILFLKKYFLQILSRVDKNSLTLQKIIFLF